MKTLIEKGISRFTAPYLYIITKIFGLPQWLSGKESASSAENKGEVSLIPGSGTSPEEGNGSIPTWRIPWTEKPVGYIPQSHTESDTTEHIHTHNQDMETGVY